MDTATTTTGRVIPWNKGKLLGQKPPLKLKEIWAIRIRLQLDHRTRELALFTRHRQQVARLRSGRASRPRRGPGQSRRSPSNRNAEEDSAAGAIRDHRTNAGRGRSLDRNGASEVGPVPLSEPRVGIATSVDPSVRPDRWSLGGGYWARSRCLWHPFDATHQADAYLPAQQESPSRSVAARSHQA